MKRTSKYIAERAKYKPYLFKLGNNWVAVDNMDGGGKSWVGISKAPLEVFYSVSFVRVPNDLIEQHLSSFGV